MLEYILCLSGGFLGIHKFYKGDNKKGYLYLFTLGLFGFGWLFDTIELTKKLNKEYQDSEQYKKYQERQKTMELKWQERNKKDEETNDSKHKNHEQYMLKDDHSMVLADQDISEEKPRESVAQYSKPVTNYDVPIYNDDTKEYSHSIHIQGGGHMPMTERPKMSKRQKAKQMKKEGIAFCPKCKGTSLQYVERRKRLSLTRGVVGSLFHPVAGVVGAVTSKKHKGYIKCLSCGHIWKK